MPAVVLVPGPSPFQALWRIGLPMLVAGLLAACGGGEQGSDTADRAGTATAAGQARMKAQAAGSSAQGGVLINEISAANWRLNFDEDGDNEDWVELYNPASVAVDLSGYGLSASLVSPFRWTFPAGQTIGPRGYLRVWLSKKNRATLGSPLHASFNLDNGADSLFLSASNGTAAGILIDSTKPALMKPDHSWCRMPSGSAAAPFQICATPTRGAANTGPSYPTMLARPGFSVASGVYAGAQSVSLSGPAGATIRYTTDGSMPTAGSAAYTGPITVATSQVIRAAAFNDTALSSPAESNTYVIDADMAGRYAGLKTLFVTMEPADLVRYQARDKRMAALVHLEMFNGAARLFKLDVDGSVAGQGGSLDSPQVAMNVNARDVFGPKDIVSAGVIWPAKPTLTKTKKLRIRNGGNDWGTARVRDQLSQDLVSAGPNIPGASTSVAMFMNGRYYALMEVREREDETIVANNAGVDKDFVDYLESPTTPSAEVKNGGTAALAAFQAAHDFIVGNDMGQPASYAQAQRLVDVNSLAWNWGHHLMLANYDWPWHNVHVYRSPEVGNLWTWRPHDFDFALGRYVGPERDMNYAYTDVGSPMFAALLRSPAFRSLFLSVAADQMNLMNPTFMNERLDAFVSDMRPYVNDTYTRNGLGGEATWNTRVAAIRSWFRLREPFHDQQLRTQFGLGNRGAIGVTLNDTAMGTVKVNTLDVGAQMAGGPAWSGRFYPGVPVTLQAQPRPGFVFVGWQGASGATTRAISHTLAATPALAADNFSVRWTGQLVVPVTGSYRFQTIADDGIRVRIAGQTLIDSFTARAETVDTSAAITLTAGQRVDVLVEAFEGTGAATKRLLWLRPGQAEYVPVPATQFFPDAAATRPTGLTGRYHANATLTGNPVAQAIEAIDFAWGTAAPTPSQAQFHAVFAPAVTPSVPTVEAVAAQNLRTGDLVNLALSAADANGYPLTFSASGLPRGVGIHPRSGIIHGRLTTPGSYNTTVTVNNGLRTVTTAIAWSVGDRPGTATLGTSADSAGQSAPNAPPSVSLSAPAAGLSVIAGTAVTLSATAADSNGSVARVEFFDGGTLIGTDATAPYTLNWTPSAAGARLLSARAVDNLGASGSSAAVAINVAAPPPVIVPLPAGAVGCAAEGASCAVPAGRTATVYYGVGSTWVARTGVSGSLVCGGAGFGDPAPGQAKACRYLLDPMPTQGLLAEYWANPSLSGAPVLTRAELPFMQSWGGATPGEGLPSSLFSVRWNGRLAATTTGRHLLRLQASSGDGTRMWINGVPVVDDWTSPVATRDVPVTLTAGVPVDLRIEFFDAAAEALFSLSWQLPGSASFVRVPVSALTPGASSNRLTGMLNAQYWPNLGFTGAPTVVRNELPRLNLASGVSADPRLPSSGFAVRWTGLLTAPASGNWLLSTVSSSADGTRLRVAGQLVIDNWTSPVPSREASVSLTAGQAVPIELEFFDLTGAAAVTLRWQAPGATGAVEIPADRFSVGAQ